MSVLATGGVWFLFGSQVLSSVEGGTRPATRLHDRQGPQGDLTRVTMHQERHMDDVIARLSGHLPGGSVIIIIPEEKGESGPDTAVDGVAPVRVDQNPYPEVSCRESEGDAPLRLREWGRILQAVSARELQRAADQGALETQIRKEGLGHGAVEVRPSAVRRYLETCDAVQEGRMPAPDWWESVRLGRNGRIFA